MQAGQNHNLALPLAPRLFSPWELTALSSPVVAMRTGVDDEQLTLTLCFPSPQNMTSAMGAESHANPRGWHSDKIPMSSPRN